MAQSTGDSSISPGSDVVGFQPFWCSSSASFPLHPSVHPCSLSKLSFRWSVFFHQLSNYLPASLCDARLPTSHSIVRRVPSLFFSFFLPVPPSFSRRVIVINGSRGVSVGWAAFSLELSAINQACLPSPGVHKHAHKIGFFFFSRW